MIQRFEQKYIKTPRCWEWKAAKNDKGYGKFSTRRSIWEYAHRLSYMIYKGDFDQKLLICHRCDNPSCVNPNHLFVGTHSDNMKDAFDKGRNKNPIMVGDDNPKSKMTEKQLKEILSRVEAGEKPRDFYKEYGVHFHSIYARIRRFHQRVISQ